MRPQQVKIGIASAVAIAGIGIAAWYNTRDKGTSPQADTSTSPTVVNRDSDSTSPGGAEPIRDPESLNVHADPPARVEPAPAPEEPAPSLADTAAIETPDRGTTSDFTGVSSSDAVAIEPSRAGEDHSSPIGPIDPAAPDRLEISRTPAPGVSTDASPEPAPTPSVSAPEPLKLTVATGLSGTATHSTASAATRPADAAFTTHEIKSGDTFSALAMKYLGHAKYTNLISKANPDVDPRRLRIGMKVKIPPASTTQPAAADGIAMASPSPLAGPVAPNPAAVREQLPPVPSDRAYRVKAGEGWSELARRFLGSAERWPELYELNRGRVVRDPNGLREGTVIELPQTQAAPPAAPESVSGTLR